MTKELFREEAIRHRTRALYGDVILATPRITWILTALLIAMISAIIGFCIFGTIDVNGVDIPIWRWALGRP